MLHERLCPNAKRKIVTFQDLRFDGPRLPAAHLRKQSTVSDRAIEIDKQSSGFRSKQARSRCLRQFLRKLESATIISPMRTQKCARPPSEQAFVRSRDFIASMLASNDEARSTRCLQGVRCQGAIQ